MVTSSPRLIYSLGCLLCLILLGSAFYLEYIVGQLPCLLCQLQRIVMMMMAVIFFIAACHNPQRIGRFIYSALLLIVGIGGLLLAGKQLWLIAHPPLTADPCSASLSYLISALPLSKALSIAIQGSGDCAKATWHFLSLSIPAWSFISFSVLSLLSLIAGFRYNNP